jgi:hypothetical protein
MKTLLLASVLALSASAGTAFASVTTYTDGSTYDSTTGITTAPRTLAMGGSHTMSDALSPIFRKNNDPKVVRWGPPSGDQGGA